MNKRELSKVFSKLSSKEVNLESHRVELSFIQDIQQLINTIYREVDASEKEASSLDGKIGQIMSLKDILMQEAKKHEGTLDGLKEFKGEVKEMKNKVSQAAKDLGVDIKNIKGMDDLDGALEESIKAMDNLGMMIKDAKKEAK